MKQIKWTFKKKPTQNYTHGLHQYPARLHPAIVNTVINKFPKTDLVIDPFMGSGTSAIACLKTNRNFIGFEISKKYFNMCSKRIKSIRNI